MAHRSLVTVAHLLLLGCGPRPVTVEFYPVAGQEHFACTSAWGHVGVSDSVVQPKDFRLLVSEVRFRTVAGRWVPMSLDEVEGQHAGVGLLDFEDGSGTCGAGTPATRYVLEGSVRDEGRFAAVELTLGAQEGAQLPANAAALAPGGRPRGLAVELITPTHPHWVFHLASPCAEVGCGDGRLQVLIEGVDATERILFVDLLPLLQEADLERAAEAPDLVAGCASDPLDVDCPPLLRALGVGAPQRVFRPSTWAVGSVNHSGHGGH